MKTRFYKILYKRKDVVYVGVTTRPITERFKEHLISKRLNENYSVIEFDCVEHPEFTTLEIYYKEKRKVVMLEQKYIKEEIERGSNLLNVSKGGEWGSNILEKLRREDFLRRFGSYDNYAMYKFKREKCNGWLRNWVIHRTESQVKRWLGNWTVNRGVVKSKRWIKHWISHRSNNKVKVWFRCWLSSQENLDIKTWLKSWVYSKGGNKVKRWTRNWVNCRSQNNIKKWLRSWVQCRTRNKFKVWLRNWVFDRSTPKAKRWLKNWVVHRKRR